MTRTYQTREQYEAACERLAAHLNTLTTDGVSFAYANGGTTDAAGNSWVPAQESLMESRAWTKWFMEEHGAAAEWSGGQWVAREPRRGDELSDAALAIWGEDSDDFGYPQPA